jgi:co-chaperonin GroES (HSP10)
MTDKIEEKLLARKFEPIRKNIIFKFCSNLTHTNFMPTSKGGIIITDNNSYDEHTHPQYGEIICVGPEVSDEIKNAKYILVEEGKWTNKVRFEGAHGEYVWKTEEQYVLSVGDEYVSWH